MLHAPIHSFFLPDTVVTVNQVEPSGGPGPSIDYDKAPILTEPSEEPVGTGDVEVQRDISEGIPEMSLRPQAESAQQQQLQQQQVGNGPGRKERLSTSRSVKSAGKGDKSKSSRRGGKKDKTSRRGHKKELIDDTLSEISYQPDTDLSRSRASKKVFTG